MTFIVLASLEQQLQSGGNYHDKNEKISSTYSCRSSCMFQPMPVMASHDTEVVESLLDSGIDFLASDPGKAVDIIMYAKDLVDQQKSQMTRYEVP